MNVVYMNQPCPCSPDEHTRYITVIYLQQSAVEWHLVIEEACHQCFDLTQIDIPFSKLEAQIRDLEELQVQEAARFETSDDTPIVA